MRWPECRTRPEFDKTMNTFKNPGTLGAEMIARGEVYGSEECVHARPLCIMEILARNQSNGPRPGPTLVFPPGRLNGVLFFSFYFYFFFFHFVSTAYVRMYTYIKDILMPIRYLLYLYTRRFIHFILFERFLTTAIVFIVSVLSHIYLIP